MNENVFDNRYKLYVFGTNDVSECLNNGLFLSTHYQFEGFLDKLNMSAIESDMFCELLDKICENKKCDNLIIVKIPLYYLGWVHRDGLTESFVPMVKKVSYDGKTFNNYLIPELIFAVYKKRTNVLEYNEYYNVFYNPNGLQFLDEQIINMYKYGCLGIHYDAFRRRLLSYDDLRREDIVNKTWDKTMGYYKSSKVKRLLLNFNTNHRGRR